MFNEVDTAFMSQALALAARGRYTARPNPMVGAVLVKEGHLIGEGYHAACGQAHAEVMALQQATADPRGAVCYVTLEPCAHQGRTPPCVNALIEAGIARVVVAMVDPNPLVAGKGIEVLRAQGIQVEIGLLAEEAAALNAGYVMRHTRHRPLVLAKIAMSLDGRTAMASGESQWITSSASRERVQQLRAESGAILTSINTVLADNPRLTVRSEAIFAACPQDTKFNQPKRVLLDRQNRAPEIAAIFSEEAPTWHVTGNLDLAVILNELAASEVNQVLIEAGSQLVGAFLAAGLVDDLLLFYAPKLLGHEGQPMAMLPQIKTLDQHVPLNVKSIEQVGTDIYVRASVHYGSK